MPTKLDNLKRQAIESCKFRRHTMTRFVRLGECTHESVCIHCAKSVVVNIRPMPNEIDIGGTAVALNCI